MIYYNINGRTCCSELIDLPYPRVEIPQRVNELYYLFRRPAADCRSGFAPHCAGQLFARTENCGMLNTNALPNCEPDPLLKKMLALGKVRALNIEHPRFMDNLTQSIHPKKCRVNILALGDVGGTLLTGLRLLGSDVISSIGICDISEQMASRWEMEANQINYPWDYDSLPSVEVVQPDELFNCDMFVFVASKGIPPVGSQVKDVRMAQFETNRAIASHYARMAREKKFRGLYCQVSDPIDPLAKAVYLESNKDENGIWDGKGLLPEQIQGFGLGVMNARAAYYAKKDIRYSSFLTEGRAYGPHGKELVIADSIAHYNDLLSRELTQKAVEANLVVRDLGFKPYVAPALSSGAISLILTLRGEWHYGSVFLGGSFMGCKTRFTPMGQEVEALPLPAPLFERILAAEAALKEII